jgi:organic radical activating enzyme
MLINVKFPFDLNFLDYPDPESFSIIVFVMGCEKHCVSCHNPQLQNYDYKINTKKFCLTDFKNEIQKALKKNNADSLVLSGGDPLGSRNIEFVKFFLLETNFSTCIYTGNDIEYVKQNDVKGFKFIKCGKFLESEKQVSEKTDNYLQFSSKNQQLYDSSYKLISTFGKHNFNI